MGIIALVVVIGFSFVACDNGGDDEEGNDSNGDQVPGSQIPDNDVTPPTGSGGTPANPVGTIYLGETLELSGQVYTQDAFPFTYTSYNSNLVVFPYYAFNPEDSSVGSITNGQLNCSIGESQIPEYSKTNDFSNNDNDALINRDKWDNVHASTVDVKFFWLKLNTFFPETNQKYGPLSKENISKSGNYTLYEYVAYLYVDKDVVLKGEGKLGYYITTTNFNLTLKKGWNAIYRKEIQNSTDAKTTITVFLSNPTLRLVLSRN